MKLFIILLVVAAIMLPFQVVAQSAVVNSYDNCRLNRLPEVKTFVTTSAGTFTNVAVNYDGSDPHVVFTGVTGAICDENNMDTAYVNGDQYPIGGLTDAEIQNLMNYNDVV